MDSLITDQDQPLRSACDRCHVHKVRCSQTVENENGTSMNKPCSRCLKAQVPCVVGLRGKVGRPAKNMKRKVPSCEDPHHHVPEHDGRPQEHPPVGCWVGPDAGPGTRSAMMAAALPGGPEPRTEATAHPPCLQSPRLCLTPEDTSPFSFSFIDIDNREPSSTLPPGLGTPFPQDFGFSSFASPRDDGNTYFQEPFLATAARSSVAGDDNVLGSPGLNDAPTDPFQCLGGVWGVRDHAQDPNALMSNQCGSASQTPSGGQQQTPTPASSTSLPAGTRSSHERLCRISLRISEAAAGFAQDGASASVVALKGVVGLASELNETARQILVQQQGQDPSSARSSTAGNSGSNNMPARDISNGEGGGGRSPFASSASSVTAYEHASSSSSSNCARHTPGEAALDPALVFLLLACYAGFLSVFELVLERLWAQCGGPSSREEGKTTGRGTRFLSTLLEASLAVHTVHCLFKLLREALFPEDLRDRKNNDAVSDSSGIALVGGRGPVVARGAGRGTARRLLERTCEDIRQRGEDILKSTEELQQRLVR